MKAVVQRVSKASVSINHAITASIDTGICVFLGIHRHDTTDHSLWMIDKLLNLRLFSDTSGSMTDSISDKQYGILVVSQFTLYGNCQKGRRPSFERKSNYQTVDWGYAWICRCYISYRF